MTNEKKTIIDWMPKLGPASETWATFIDHIMHRLPEKLRSDDVGLATFYSLAGFYQMLFTLTGDHDECLNLMLHIIDKIEDFEGFHEQATFVRNARERFNGDKGFI
ncbi:MAG: hypothetical protein GY826_16570 [Fuerstiella sp.]|nr:hypothetical protein [Fuerstiella sp.]